MPATTGLKKDSDRTITPGAEAECPCTVGTARVPTSQAAVPPSHSTLTGAERPQAKNVLCQYMKRHFSSVQLCNSVDGGLPGFSVRESSSAGRDTGAYWPILDAIPF